MAAFFYFSAVPTPRAWTLLMEWFRTRQEAVPLIETWRKHYNSVRPHSSLGYLTPHEFKAKNEQLISNQAEASLSRFDWSEGPRQVSPAES